MILPCCIFAKALTILTSGNSGAVAAAPPDPWAASGSAPPAAEARAALCCCAADEEDEWRPPQPQPRLKNPMAPPPPPPDAAAPAAARTVALAGEAAAWEASESVEALASENGEAPGTETAAGAAAAGGGGEAPAPRTVVEVALGEALLALCPMAAAVLLAAGVGELEVKSTISCAAVASLDSASSSMVVLSDLKDSEVKLGSTEMTEQM